VQNQSGFTPIPRPAARAPEPIDQGPGEFHGALRDPHRVRDLLRFRPNEILSPDACPPSHPAHAKGQRTVMSENTHAFFAGEPMEQFPRGVGQVEERAANPHAPCTGDCHWRAAVRVQKVLIRQCPLFRLRGLRVERLGFGSHRFLPVRASYA